MHGPGQAHADTHDLLAAGAGLVEHLGDHARRQRDRLSGRQVGVQRRVALGEHGVGEVGERDTHVALAEVQPEGDAGVAVSATSADGRPHRAVGARLLLGHQPIGLKLGDDGGDGRRRECRAPREVRPRAGPGRGEDAEHTRASVHV